MSLLEVRGVSKVYGALTALSNVDLTVLENEFHGLIGPNGSGKSTLLKCIAGAEMATGGTIQLAGQDITRAAPAERARAGMSLKFQITSIMPALSVYDNLLLALQARDSPLDLLRSRSRQALDARAALLLEQFRLTRRQDDIAGVLSHGEQQWLEIAMALAREPRLLLLDEPTAGMSHAERRATGELLEPIKARCSLLIVEHDLDFIKDICDTLTVLDQGQVLDSGDAKAIEGSKRVQEVYLSRV
jgi:branched-chain amino acid transport system ATP-binding protein